MDAPEGQPRLRRAGHPAQGPVSMLGWNHFSAPLDVLEAVAVPQRERPELLGLLAEVADEVVLLSTCSRTEVYADPTASLDDLLTAVARHRGCAPAVLAASAEHRTGAAAVEHLFRVTAGLESRIAGEPEVCGQVRRAVRDARRAGTVRGVLTPAFTAAVRCAQRVRDVAGLGSARRSWGARAVDVGICALRPAATRHVLVVGSGRMATDVVEVLVRRGLPPVVVARDVEAARRLGGRDRARPLTSLAAALGEADLVFCTTSAAHDVVTVDDVRSARAGQLRPMVVMDLSVPRNVEPGVAHVPGVRLLGPQHLSDDGSTDVVLASAVETGSAIVRVEAERYLAEVAARRAGPLIAALRRRAQELCLAELQRAAPAGTRSDELERAARLVAARLVHQPTLTARAAAAAGDAGALRVLAHAFGVEAAVPAVLDEPAVRRPSPAEDGQVVTAAHGRRSTA